MQIELTEELQTIFDNIVAASKHSSRELLQLYDKIPEFHEFSLQLKTQWVQLKEEIADLRKKHYEISDLEFFQMIVIQHSKQIIEGIKKEYQGKLTSAVIDRLNKFNLEVIYDEGFKHDMTAFTDKSKVSINTAYFAKGQSLEYQIVQAMGTMPHEIFHFVIKMLKDSNIADERMVYELANGEIASNLGMVGHMLNEGFVEKISSDFCKRNTIFFTISPSYIQFVNLCNYMMQNNSQISEEFLMAHNYEGVLALCSPEVIKAYKQTERVEYANVFKLKLQDGSYRQISEGEILRSYNEFIQLNIDLNDTSKNDDSKRKFYQQYRSSLIQYYLSEKDVSSFLISKFIMIDGAKPKCNHTLERIVNGKREILQQYTFDFDNQFKQEMLEPSFVDYAECSPTSSFDIKQFQTGNGINTQKADYQSVSENNNILNICNVSSEYANTISSALQQIEPITYKQYIEQHLTLSQSNKQGNGVNHRGVIDILFLSGVVGFVVSLVVMLTLCFIK